MPELTTARKPHLVKLFAGIRDSRALNRSTRFSRKFRLCTRDEVKWRLYRHFVQTGIIADQLEPESGKGFIVRRTFEQLGAPRIITAINNVYR